MTWWQWLLLVLLVPVAIVAFGILWGGAEWVHKLITGWLFRR